MVKMVKMVKQRKPKPNTTAKHMLLSALLEFLPFKENLFTRFTEESNVHIRPWERC